VARRETRHPAAPAAELAERHSRLELEQPDDVAEIDQEPGRLLRRVPERLLS
jgi:hypothetical protein